eukprot:snap_masked-scaffold_71-processed-gene-0.15-mRNA-1 protein AED:1.00 eAED:1.00 QI:0/0/0/0/1/1/3/0/648
MQDIDQTNSQSKIPRYTTSSASKAPNTTRFTFNNVSDSLENVVLSKSPPPTPKFHRRNRSQESPTKPPVKLLRAQTYGNYDPQKRINNISTNKLKKNSTQDYSFSSFPLIPFLFYFFLSLDLSPEETNTFQKISDNSLLTILDIENPQWCENICQIYLIFDESDEKIVDSILQTSVSYIDNIEYDILEESTHVFLFNELFRYSLEITIDDYRPTNDMILIIPIPQDLNRSLSSTPSSTDLGIDFLFKLQERNPFDSSSTIPTYEMMSPTRKYNISSFISVDGNKTQSQKEAELVQKYAQLVLEPIAFEASRLDIARVRHTARIASGFSQGVYDPLSIIEDEDYSNCLAVELLCAFLEQPLCKRNYVESFFTGVKDVDVEMESSYVYGNSFYDKVNLGLTLRGEAREVLSMHSGTVMKSFRDSRTDLFSVVLRNANLFSTTLYAGFEEDPVVSVSGTISERLLLGELVKNGNLHIEATRNVNSFEYSGNKQRVNVFNCIRVRELDINIEIHSVGALKNSLYFVEAPDGDELKETCVINGNVFSDRTCGEFLDEYLYADKSSGGLGGALPYSMTQIFSATNFNADSLDDNFYFTVTPVKTFGDIEQRSPILLILEGLMFRDDEGNSESYQRYFSNPSDTLGFDLNVDEET